ncbi:MAG TPA: tetratricopeptide repeat protein [Gemmataceae bacterium]|nr:tetratricopeptide repeat protein [Gemmataceae bacterium]
MNRHLPAALLLLCAASPTLAAGPSLKEARERWLRGNYDEARAAYEELLKDPASRTMAAVGLSRALQSQGEYDKALAVLKDAKDGASLARRAELLYVRGRWDDAEKAADSAVEADKDNFLAHWVQAQIYRDRGDLKKADATCRWFVRAYNNADIKDPEQLMLVGLAAAEYSRWHNLSDQLSDILSDLYGGALKLDKSYWPAEYQAGMLLLEKYNLPEALGALDKVLTINPSAAEALVGKGVVALQKMEIKDAESFAERALKVNPHLPEGLRLRADVHLAVGDPAAALKELEQARTINPRDERTLARVAACYLLQRKPAEAEALAKAAEKFNPRPALFYYELGERLEDRRHFADAEKYFRKAVALNEQAVEQMAGKEGKQPTLPGPVASLGMLYMRLGREQEAAELLDKGFKADPFNVRVSNTRRVLRHLKNYETLKTEHFELRFDPKTDKAQAHYMAKYLEAIYADLAGKFKYRPKGPILIEVFNNHDMFSGRVVALPDLHTIGACTGRMVAMVSPHGRGIRKPFNWGRVLRHELVHIFNLEQTNFLVPHWLTEGLAVSNEGFPRPPTWNELLRRRVPAGELMNLDDIDLGFIRPRTPAEWTMAYCQSQLYVDYLTKKYGPGAVGDMLAAYADGLNTEAALRKVCKVEKADFEKGYRAHLDAVVKSLGGKPAEKRRSLKELKAAHEKDKDDAETAAELALRYLESDRVKARELAEGVLEKKKDHATASYVLARLARLGGDVKQERKLLEAALNKDAPDVRVLQALGKMYYDASEFDKATEVFELGRKAEPGEPDWLQGLAKVYTQGGDKAKLIGVLKELVPTDADDFAGRLKLARLLLDEKQPAEAERYAKEALEIDVRSAEAREALFKALKAQNKEAEADAIQQILAK